MVTIGYHALYKIEDVSMIYIPVVGMPSNYPEELKYAKLFQVNVNFTIFTNFILERRFHDQLLFCLHL